MSVNVWANSNWKVTEQRCVPGIRAFQHERPAHLDTSHTRAPPAPARRPRSPLVRIQQASGRLQLSAATFSFSNASEGQLSSAALPSRLETATTA